MRTLLIAFATFLVTTQAFAARLQSVNKLESSDLQSIEQAFEGSIEQAEPNETPGQDIGASQGLKMKIVSKKPSEKLANTIKQAIYISNAGPFTTPSKVSVTELSDSAADIEKATEAALEYVSFTESSPVEDLRRSLTDILPKKNLKKFIAVYGNDYGGVSELVVVDTKTQEILAVGTGVSSDE